MTEIRRCDWCGEQPLYQDYHDREWGVPIYDEVELFERLTLEGMQAGLSWWTVLQKRTRMRQRFREFNPEALAACGELEIRDWLQDPGLIRHRGKLEAMIENARITIELDDFPGIIWSSVDGAPVQNAHASLGSVPAQTEQSQALARRLRKAGFRFVGPTTVYAFMQSAGLVNDHLVHCPRHAACRQLAVGSN